MTRLFFKLRYYPNLKEDRFLIIFYFHRMKSEKIFNCPHKVWFFLPNFPWKVDFLFHVELVCTLLT